MLTGTFIYTYFADALLSGVTGSGKKAMTNLIIASVLLILISLVPTIYKKFKKTKAVRRTTNMYYAEKIFSGWIPKVTKKLIRWFG